MGFSYIRTLKRECIQRFYCIGIKPICNSRRDRAPIIFGFCFPLCWRCTSILLAYVIVNLLIRFGYFPNYFTGLILGLILQFPILADGLLQYGLLRESTNFRRIITGLCSGIGLGYMDFFISQFEM